MSHSCINEKKPTIAVSLFLLPVQQNCSTPRVMLNGLPSGQVAAAAQNRGSWLVEGFLAFDDKTVAYATQCSTCCEP